MKNRYWLLIFVALNLMVSVVCNSVEIIPPADDNPSPTNTPVPADAPQPPEASLPPNLTEARVVKVVDGDTIDVLIDREEYRVRYILVNTPETKHPTKGVEPFGPEAFEANKELVAGKTIQLEKDVSENDQYGRLLRYVYVDGQMINEELLRRGLAHVVTFPPDVKYVDRFMKIQKQAQQAGAGMWADADLSKDVVIVSVDKKAEFADIENRGSDTKNLKGWTLVSERGDQRCPLDGTLPAGGSLRVWALAADAGQPGYNCGFDSGIWSNSNLDPAVLLNADGITVSRFE